VYKRVYELISNKPFLTPIIQTADKFVKYKTPYIGPSNLVNLCEREYFLQLKYNATVQFPFQTALQFESGFLAEDLVEYILSSLTTRILKGSKLKILSKQLNLPVDRSIFTSPRGRSDLVITITDNDSKDPFDLPQEDVYLLEIKKMSLSRFNRFKKNGYKVESAALYQLVTYLQAAPYAANLKFPYPTKGIIIGICLDPPNIWDNLIDWNQEQQTNYLAKFNTRHEVIRTLRKSLETSKFDPDAVPNRPYDISSFQCQGCSVLDYCYGKENKSLNSNLLSANEKSVINHVAFLLANVRKDLAALKQSERKLLLLLQKIIYKYDVDNLYFEGPNATVDCSTSVLSEDTVDLDDLRLKYPEVVEDLLYQKDTVKIKLHSKIISKLTPEEFIEFQEFMGDLK